MAAPFPSPTSKWHTEKYDSISPTRPELSAKGKTVLVTGGGTGIGAETALYFALAGASRIALLGRREQPLLDTKATIEQKCPGVDVFVASTDITKKSEVDDAFAKFLGDTKLNVLISNAGMSGPLEGVGNVDVEAFMNGIQVNLGGALHVAQAFLRHAAKDAVVVDVNSNAAHMNFADAFASYSVAKFSVYRLWDHLSFNNPEMSVFHIQPGIIDTAMNREVGGIEATGIEDNGKYKNLPMRRNEIFEQLLIIPKISFPASGI
jgi:NAD(P)-dependent dehydrogenase (short-subunit alcohol dehydrogenase family)